MIGSTTPDISREDDRGIGNGAREAARKFARRKARFVFCYLFPVQFAGSLLVIVAASVLIGSSSGIVFWLACFMLACALLSHSLRVWSFATGRYPKDEDCEAI